MELRQLVYFDAVVRQGGFTRAAEHLRIAQPAVSAQIRRLETELGTVLLQRTTRRVALTHAGELFLIRVRRVLDELDGARFDLDELAAVLRGHVRVGATQVLGSVDLPVALADFRRRYPEVRLALQSGLIALMLDAMDAGDIDIVLGPIHPELPDRYDVLPLCEETLVLVTPPGQRVAADGAGTLAAVRDEPFVCLPAGSGLHGILTAAATAEGFVPRIEFETHSPASIRELVSAGVGVALLARSTARAPGPVVEIHQLKTAPRHPPIGMLSPRARSLTPAALAFRNHLVRTLGSEPQAIG